MFKSLAGAGRVTSIVALVSIWLFPVIAAAADGDEPRGRRPLMEATAVTFDLFPGSLVNDPRPGTFEELVETEITTANFLLRFPVVFSPGRTMLLNTVSYNFLRFDYKDWINDDAPYQPSEFHALRWEAGLRHRLGQTWWLGASLKPGLVSDFENIDGKHLSLNGDLTFTRTKSSRLAWGFGAAYLNDFGEPVVLPVVIFRWANASEEILVDVLLPKRAEAWRVMSPVVSLGILARVQGDHYRIGEEGLLNEDSTLKYSTITVGPGAKFTLGRGTSLLRVSAGMAFSRPFELRDDNGDALLTLDLEPGFFLRAGISFMR